MAGFFDDLIGPLSRALPGVADAATSGGGAAAVLSALGREAVGRVELRSQVSPPVVVNDPLAPSNEPPNFLLRFLKPEARVYDQQGKLIVAVAPAGEPTENYLPYFLVGGGLLVIGAWVAGAFVVRRIFK